MKFAMYLKIKKTVSEKLETSAQILEIDLTVFPVDR